ncbi:hypothetical protein BD560DRAFT_490093 [Blakeslea trispora]|nr:hypothetical protein BD560DRAFT_490093 [Blakeslea trispora]
MKTNNHAENRLNQLKTTNSKRKTNRRVDRLVHNLVNNVGANHIQNINCLNLRIGRMGPQEREARKRELCAEQISASILAEYVCEVSAGDSTNEDLRITSFTNEGTHYNVCVDEGRIVSCSCPYFVQRQTACKHMYLARRYNPALQIQQANQLEDFPAFDGLVEPLGNDANARFTSLSLSPSAPSVPSAPAASLQHRLANIESLVGYFKSVSNVSDDMHPQFKKVEEILLQLKAQDEQEVVAPNQNLRTQR